jgi:hypothetical protein
MIGSCARTSRGAGVIVFVAYGLAIASLAFGAAHPSLETTVEALNPQIVLGEPWEFGGHNT